MPIIAALARPGRADTARARLGGIEIVESLDALLSRGPSIVAEVAGQAAVSEHCEAVLRSGVDCLVISVGALADPALLARLKAAAQAGKSRILLPGGRDRRHRRHRRHAGRGPHFGALPFAQAARRLARLAGRAGRRSRHAHAARPCSIAGQPARRRCSIRRMPMSLPRWRSPGSASTPPRSNWSPIPRRPAMSMRSRPKAPPAASPLPAGQTLAQQSQDLGARRDERRARAAQRAAPRS